MGSDGEVATHRKDNDVRGQTITDYSYEFKNGMIKPPSNWTSSFLAGAAGSNGGAYIDLGFKGNLFVVCKPWHRPIYTIYLIL